jgi:signal transduction histidine kinase
LSSFGRRLIEAKDRERSRVAAELRVDLNKRMALLQIGLGRFEQGIPDLPPEAREQLHSIAQLAKKVSSSIHSLSHQLHPSLLDLVGRVPSVEGLCREVSGKRNLQVQFVNHGIPEQILKGCGPMPVSDHSGSSAEHRGAQQSGGQG